MQIFKLKFTDSQHLHLIKHSSHITNNQRLMLSQLLTRHLANESFIHSMLAQLVIQPLRSRNSII